MRSARSLFLIVAIIISIGVTGQAARADSDASGRWNIILGDRQAITASDGGVELTESLIGLISTLGAGQIFAFVDASDPTALVGPAVAGGPDFVAFKREIDAAFVLPGPNDQPDYRAALAETYNLLNAGRAPSGSTVYLIAGGDLRDLDRVGRNLEPIVDLFSEKGWPIVGLSLPGASRDVREFVSSVSAGSGGQSYPLSAPEGLRNLSERLLGGSGALEPVTAPVDADEPFSSPIGIAPGTMEATILFFKAGPQGSLSLMDPSGVAAAKGDGVLSSVLEAPHVVVWRVVDPAPGQWEVAASGLEGATSLWRHGTNRYIPALESYEVLALDEAVTLVGYVSDGDRKVRVKSATLTARVTTPRGATLVHELKDDGLSGDHVANDGYYTATLPPMALGGEHRVELELSWVGVDQSLFSQSSIMIQSFPRLRLTPLQTDGIRPNERTRVATLMVEVADQPYAVSTDALTAALSSGTEVIGALEILPQRPLLEGRAWSYDVFFTPTQEGHHSLVVRLSLDYSGREYTHSANHVVLSSAVAGALSGAVTESASAVPAPTAVGLSPVVPQQAPVESTGSPWPMAGLVVVSVVLAGILIAGVSWLGRVRPYGYLYTDRDELVVDFSRVRRNPIMNLLFKSSVRGAELGAPGLEKISLEFSRRRVGLRARQVSPTVRVNNQPVGGRTSIQDRTWIGTHGKLYCFWLSPMPPRAEPSSADD